MTETKTELAAAFDKVVRERRSVRNFNSEVPVPDAVVERSLERAVLAPNSSNLQLWEFYRVKSDTMKAKVSEACFGQPAASTAQELVVVVTRRDLWNQRRRWIVEDLLEVFGSREKEGAKGAFDYYEKMIPTLYRRGLPLISDWVKQLIMFFRGMGKVSPREVTFTDTRIIVHKSAALAAENFMLSIKAEGFDSCPMEGFDSKRVKAILDLPKGAEINMIVGIGKGLPGGVYGPRKRVPMEEVVKTV